MVVVPGYKQASGITGNTLDKYLDIVRCLKRVGRDTMDTAMDLVA